MAFYLQMANQLLLKQAAKGSNFVISPSSFNVILSTIAEGATGRTLDQLHFFLKSKNIDCLRSKSSRLVALASANATRTNNGGPLLSSVNGVWVDKRFPLKPAFREIVQGIYRAETKEVDFVTKAKQVRYEVNTWAENATNGLIKDLLPPGCLHSDTTLVLANALYFKGTWNHKTCFSFGFEASETMEELGLNLPFKNVGELTKMVDSPLISKKLYVSQIIHKACIEVNEEGTEAAASSAAIMNFACAFSRSPPPTFVADHPFLFMIREEMSGIVLQSSDYTIAFLALSSCEFAGLKISGLRCRFPTVGKLETKRGITKIPVEITMALYLRMANQLLLKQAAKGSNFVISPSSLHTILSTIAEGAAGRTLDQLHFFLKSKNIDCLRSKYSRLVDATQTNTTRGPLLSLVNSVFVDKRFPLKPAFRDIVKGIYSAETKEVDFLTKLKANEVRDEVNTWAENATNGLIKDLLPPGCLDSDTTLVLANGLYFKGTWNHKFDESRTQDRDFYLLNGETVPVPFMTRKPNQKHLFRSFDGFKILKLPYKNGEDKRQFSMYFFLPDERDGLQNLLAKFSSNTRFLEQHLDHFSEEKLADFWIPKFKISFGFEASETMKELGLNLPFMKNVGELTEMVDSHLISKELYVSQIFHKACIEVNEEGTEAAASTATIFGRFASRPQTFVADHPFLFLIREELSRIVFFTGAVLNPLLLA
ncbi:hypothetical protein HHK36_009989 [Tetracentron sinense]|uniref:Serpin domain-containing protein n=1 Tax=Tetracentron sinense TaxID=13715 RepID=A0A835DIV2_TETSI|nr:hypothetical protein HHK36_009989 [Tetracentron sinense]